MLNIRMETIVGSLVRQLLIESGGNSERALHFHFDLWMSYHRDNRSYDARRGLHLLYYLPKNSSYVSVFSATFNSPRVKLDVANGQFTHEISHDSEWRNLRLFSDTYFSMAEEINRKMNVDGFLSVAPVLMGEHNNSPVFGNLFNWVTVKVEKDPDDDYNYRKIIKVLP